MAYLSPHFDWDVFVSYAHGVAPVDGEAPLKTWSRAFIEALKTDILNLSSKLPDLQIWDDRRIDPTAKLTNELREIVHGSGILLILISNRYLESSWCKDESSWFESQIKERSNDLARTFVVRVQATEHESWPKFLLDERGHPVIGFQFHPTPESPEDDVEPFGWPDLAYRPVEFRKEFASLRTAISRRLIEIKRRAGQRNSAVTTPSPSTADRRPRIYLHGAADEDLRLQIEGQLDRNPFQIISLPSEREETLTAWSKQSREHVGLAKKCDALVLIRDPTDEDFVVELLDIATDYERIIRERGSPLPWAVLDSVGQQLPSFATACGATRFDLNDPTWPDRLRAWLGSSAGGVGTPVT